MEGASPTFFLLALIGIGGGLVNVLCTEDVIQATKWFYSHSPIKPIGLTVPIVRGFGYLGIALGIVAAVVGVVFAFL